MYKDISQTTATRSKPITLTSSVGKTALVTMATAAVKTARCVGTAVFTVSGQIQDEQRPAWSGRGHGSGTGGCGLSGRRCSWNINGKVKVWVRDLCRYRAALARFSQSNLRKFAFDVTSIGQRSSPWPCKFSERGGKISRRAQALFSFCTIYVVPNTLNKPNISTYRG